MHRMQMHAGRVGVQAVYRRAQKSCQRVQPNGVRQPGRKFNNGIGAEAVVAPP